MFVCFFQSTHGGKPDVLFIRLHKKTLTRLCLIHLPLRCVAETGQASCRAAGFVKKLTFSHVYIISYFCKNGTPFYRIFFIFSGTPEDFLRIMLHIIPEVLQIMQIVVNVNIKMIKKWKIKMYIFPRLFLSLRFHKGPFFFQTV